MMKKYFCLALFMSLVSVSGYSQEIEAVEKYFNPVVRKDMPDPTVIRAQDGWFYTYTTARLTNIMKSRNLVDWTFVGTAFTPENRPNFEENAGIWAPDIEYINGKYVLYYSMSKWGGITTNGIGVAVADKPEGPFTDKGELLRANKIGVLNSIDQYYVEDEASGKKYLLWGSFNGIYGIELSDDGLSLKQGAEKVLVAGDIYEGTMIHKRGKYYYLFASIGTCCEGVTSTYQLVVGRSESLLGPYFDKRGNNMIDNGFSLVINHNDRFTGTGHCSEIVKDDAGNDWILYHAFDNTDPKGGRKLMLDRVLWDRDGWPYIKGGSPSIVADRPIFKNK